jgi:hypothetical protein
LNLELMQLVKLISAQDGTIGPQVRKGANVTENELAYIAGFFDGEGSMTIHENCKPSPRGHAPNHTLQVSIANTDPRVLHWIHAEFGGSLSYRKLVSVNHRHVTQWIIRAAKALPFLLAIQPFVRMKADQVKIGIEFQQSKSMRGPKPVAKETIDWRETKRWHIRELNARSWVQTEGFETGRVPS